MACAPHIPYMVLEVANDEGLLSRVITRVRRSLLGHGTGNGTGTGGMLWCVWHLQMLIWCFGGVQLELAVKILLELGRHRIDTTA